MQLELRNRTRYRQKSGALSMEAKPVPIGATFDASRTIGRDGKEIAGYVARITGTDPNYKLKREFLNVPQSGILTVSERGLYESRGPSTSIYGTDRANKPTEREYVLIGRKKVRNLVDFQAERAVRLMERFRNARGKPVTPPKPAEPVRYSLGGQLAPGRGTVERNSRAKTIKRTLNNRRMTLDPNRPAVISEGSFTFLRTEWEDFSPFIKELRQTRKRRLADLP